MKNQDKNKQSRAKRVRNILLMMLLDIAAAAAAYFIARTVMFFRIPSTVPNGYLEIEPYVAVASVSVLFIMLVVCDCYNSIWKYAGRIEFLKVIAAYLGTFIILLVGKIVLQLAVDIEVWIPIIIMYLIISAIISCGVRFCWGIGHYFLHVRRKLFASNESDPNCKRTVVIGAGYTGSLVINRCINNPNEGYYPVAVLDDDEEKQGQLVYGIPVVGSVKDAEKTVKDYNVEAFIIAITSITKSQLRHIYNVLAPFNLPIKIMPAITDADNITTTVKSFRDIKIEELLGRDEFKVRQELIDGSVRGKVVMVTGGAGSIGSELCRQALNFGCRHLVIFDQHENGMFFLNQEFARTYDTSRYTLVIGTVRERHKLEEAFALYKPEIVFHAAAYKHVPMMEIAATEAVKNNVMGTLNVIECAEAAGVDKFVLISTDKAVNPSNIMGASKRIAEMLIETRGKTFRMKMAAVRFGNVLGSNGSVIPIFLKEIKEGGPITLTDRNIKRYFMSIPEAVRLVLQTGAFASSGEIFVLDMGEPVYIYDLACDLIRINGLVPEQDVKIEITGLRPGEKMFEELRYDNEAVNTTAHEGVFVNKMDEIDRNKFDGLLATLMKNASDEDEQKTIKTIFTIVPSEYRRAE